MTGGRSRGYCLRLWSRFVRARDGQACVVCGDTGRLFAHHICRKVLVPQSSFMVGNGICLCRDCHDMAHDGFNGRPNPRLLIDEQGGEKLDTMTYFWGRLAESSRERFGPDDERFYRYYYLNDQMLGLLARWQTLPDDLVYPGNGPENAYYIMGQPLASMVAAVVTANMPDSLLRLSRRTDAGA